MMSEDAIREDPSDLFHGGAVDSNKDDIRQRSNRH